MLAVTAVFKIPDLVVQPQTGSAGPDSLPQNGVGPANLPGPFPNLPPGANNNFNYTPVSFDVSKLAEVLNKPDSTPTFVGNLVKESLDYAFRAGAAEARVHYLEDENQRLRADFHRQQQNLENFYRTSGGQAGRREHLIDSLQHRQSPGPDRNERAPNEPSGNGNNQDVVTADTNNLPTGDNLPLFPGIPTDLVTAQQRTGDREDQDDLVRRLEVLRQGQSGSDTALRHSEIHDDPGTNDDDFLDDLLRIDTVTTDVNTRTPPQGDGSDPFGPNNDRDQLRQNGDNNPFRGGNHLPQNQRTNPAGESRPPTAFGLNNPHSYTPDSVAPGTSLPSGYAWRWVKRTDGPDYVRVLSSAAPRTETSQQFRPPTAFGLNNVQPRAQGTPPILARPTTSSGNGSRWVMRADGSGYDRVSSVQESSVPTSPASTAPRHRNTDPVREQILHDSRTGSPPLTFSWATPNPWRTNASGGSVLGYVHPALRQVLGS